MGSIFGGIVDLFQAALQSPSPQTRAFAWVVVVVVGLVVLSIAFAAYVVWLRLRNIIRERRWVDRERRWTTLTLEAVSGERTAEDLAGRVPRRDRLPFLDFLLRYARRLAGRERERIDSLALPFLPDLERLLNDRDPYRRARAVQTLGTLGLPAYAELLVRSIGDDAPVVSMLAARALAAHGGSAYAEPIVSNLDRFEHWGPEYVTSLLSSLGAEAAPVLREVVEDGSRSPQVRARAVDALRRLHDLETPELAVRIFDESPEPDLAAALLRMIATLGGPDHIRVVRPLLAHSHFAVRAEAYSTLGALGTKDDLEVLEEGLEDPSPWVALHAARGMRSRGGKVRLLKLAESGHPGALAAAQVLAEE